MRPLQRKKSFIKSYQMLLLIQTVLVELIGVNQNLFLISLVNGHTLSDSAVHFFMIFCSDQSCVHKLLLLLLQ